jgi:23S rRNA (guanosine2251-2'-O)-methyltransferase
MIRETEYIFGFHSVLEAIKAGKQIDRLLIKQGLKGALYHELMGEVRKRSIPFQYVPLERIELVTRKNHQGILALLSLIEYQSISNLLPTIFEKGEDPLILVLDGVSDVRNFGAVVRSAECLGAHAVIIPEKGSARITADAIKTSAGALHSFPVCRERNLALSLQFLKDSGVKIIGASEKADQDITITDLKGPLALILGAEDKGISPQILSITDMSIRIPLTGGISSLNVSVAAGILLYEISRQRRDRIN